VQKKPRKKQLPKEVIDHWPEVFKDVHIDVVPIEYLNSVRVEFVDGKIWDIDINTEKKPVKDLEKSLDDLFEQYQNVIKNVDFRLDTDKVKADITKRTKKFLKLRR
jgi:hypothetical protein